MELQDFIKKYRYKSDPLKKDVWVIPKLSNGIYSDDCDGLALGVLYYVLAKESLWAFWYLLIFTNTRIFYVTTSEGIGHVVLRHNNQYIDTYSKTWVSKERLIGYGHKFHWTKMFFFWQVALKMLIGKILTRPY